MADNSNYNGSVDDNSAEDNKDAGHSETNMGAALYERSQSLVDMANNTFKEFCRTLENEQTKLMELEERRKKLQEEMELMKVEIEEAKQLYSLADNLGTSRSSRMDATGIQVNSETILNDSEPMQMLNTCYEMDESTADESDEQELTVRGSLI